MKYVILLIHLGWYVTLLAQSSPKTITTVVLINGDPVLVDLTEKGDITAIYQSIPEYFTTPKSHESIVAQASAVKPTSRGTLTAYSKETEPTPSYTVENTQPITAGADQYIGFSPIRALLLDNAVIQIRKISRSLRSGEISQVAITSYHNEDFRSKALSRNRADAIKDLLIAFGASASSISISSTPRGPDAKIDYVRLTFYQ